MLHIKNSSPCPRKFSSPTSRTRQQPITIFSSTNTPTITVFSLWKLQFLLLSSLSHCLPLGVPLRLSYVLRSISLVRLSLSLYPLIMPLISRCPRIGLAALEPSLPQHSDMPPSYQAKRHLAATSGKLTMIFHFLSCLKLHSHGPAGWWREGCYKSVVYNF